MTIMKPSVAIPFANELDTAPVQILPANLAQSSCGLGFTLFQYLNKMNKRWPDHQSRQLVRKTPFCSVTISFKVRSQLVKPNSSMAFRTSGVDLNGET